MSTVDNCALAPWSYRNWCVEVYVARLADLCVCYVYMIGYKSTRRDYCRAVICDVTLTMN